MIVEISTHDLEKAIVHLNTNKKLDLLYKVFEGSGFDFIGNRTTEFKSSMGLRGAYEIVGDTQYLLYELTTNLYLVHEILELGLYREYYLPVATIAQCIKCESLGQKYSALFRNIELNLEDIKAISGMSGLVELVIYGCLLEDSVSRINFSALGSLKTFYYNGVLSSQDFRVVLEAPRLVELKINVDTLVEDDFIYYLARNRLRGGHPSIRLQSKSQSGNSLFYDAAKYYKGDVVAEDLLKYTNTHF